MLPVFHMRLVNVHSICDWKIEKQLIIQCCTIFFFHLFYFDLESVIFFLDRKYSICFYNCCNFVRRRVWRNQRSNQNPEIEEQTTQWPKEKVQRYKQPSTKLLYKTKDRVTRTSLKTWVELKCSGRVSSSCFTSGTRRVNLVICHIDIP